MDTIFDRPRGLRLIGLTQVSFGSLGLLALIGLVLAMFTGAGGLGTVGPIYSVLILFGVVIPCIAIGNYVDDLRRNAVVAQIVYSLFACGLTGYYIYLSGLSTTWSFPWLELVIVVQVGYLAAAIFLIEAFMVLYLLGRWNAVVPPPGVYIERDREKARLIEQNLIPSPLAPTLLGADGETSLTPEEGERILDVRRVTTAEGMAVLCSNCGGATPLTKVEDNNTLVCDYCGVRLGLSSVFIPCNSHPEYLAATTCDVCGEHYCRQCLTAQEPPVDERWKGSIVHICRKCFEGRYKPAVTTASLVIPIDKLFESAGSRFGRVGNMYKKFLGKYASAMKYVIHFSARMASSMMRSGGGRGGRGGDNAIAFLIMIVIAIVAIPLIIGFLLILGAIVIIPLLFYAGLIGVAIEAARIIAGTDFVSLAEQREKGVREGRPVKQRESTLREPQRDWQSQQSRPRFEITQQSRSDEFFSRRAP